MDTIQNYKCPCCGAPLVFSGEKQMLHCASCSNDFEPETIKLVYEADEAANSESHYEWNEYTPRQFTMEDTTLREYECPSCGAQITGDNSTGATICPYCGNTTIMKDKFEGVYMPDYIIPFRVEKKSAMELLQSSAKKKFLIPSAFKSESKLKKIMGVYVPFWMFDCDADADITYTGERVTTWHDSRYDYVKTDFYRLFRSGKAQFENIPVDASLAAENEYMDALEPFDYGDAVKFNSSYLSGYLADKYDVSVDDSIERANKRIRSSMESILMRDTHKYAAVRTESASIRFHDGKVRYALLPVWMLNVAYGGSLYKFAINGQTGKIVGQYPVDKGKLFLLRIGLFALITVIGAGICWLAKKWGLVS